MAQGPENRMLNRLKPRLEEHLGVYIEKMANPYRGGTPDWYIEGPGGCAGWIEAKFWDVKNVFGVMSVKTPMEKMSTRQFHWLTRASENGLPTALLCGFPDTNKYLFVRDPSYDFDPLHETISRDGLVETIHQWLFGYEMEKTL